jgi:predicted ATPase
MLDEDFRDPKLLKGTKRYYRGLLKKEPKPNEEQQQIINEIRTAFDAYRQQMEWEDPDITDVPRCFFISGEGGCGKTFLFNVKFLQ